MLHLTSIRFLRKAVSELISTVILTAVALSIGLAMFYLVNNWVSETYQRSRIFNLADNAVYDFNVNIEAFARNPAGGYDLYVRIIRIGGLQVSGLAIFISVEATNSLLKKGSDIWSLPTSEIYVLDAGSYVAFSDPIDPATIPSTPSVLRFTQCSSSPGSLYTFKGSSLVQLYIRSMDQWVSLGDFRRDLVISLCKIPLPPAPLGHILVKVSFPSAIAGYQNIVVSGWVVIGGKVFNIFNVLYRNI